MTDLTIKELKKFILHEAKGVSLLEGSIELPDYAVVDIIKHYERRLKASKATK